MPQRSNNSAKSSSPPTIILLEPDANIGPHIAVWVLLKGWSIVAVRTFDDLMLEIMARRGQRIMVVAANMLDGQELLPVLTVAEANGADLPPIILRVYGGTAALGAFEPFVVHRPIKVFDEWAPASQIERAIADFADYFFPPEIQSQARPPGRSSRRVRRRAACPTFRLAGLRVPRPARRR